MDAISTMVQCVGMHTLRRVSTVHIPHSGVRKLPVLSMYFRFVNQEYICAHFRFKKRLD